MGHPNLRRVRPCGKDEAVGDGWRVRGREEGGARGRIAASCYMSEDIMEDMSLGVAWSGVPMSTVLPVVRLGSLQ